MAMQHEVWAVPLNKVKPRFFAAFELARWQWAEKLAASLRDKGHDGVEVREEDDGEDDPGDE